MGTNCSPVVANLYLFAYEFDFIERLLTGKVEGLDEEEAKMIAVAFHLTFRYIDDTLSIDNPFWERFAGKCSEEGGLYPRALVLNKTHRSINDTTFIGIHIVSDAMGHMHLSECL